MPSSQLQRGSGLSGKNKALFASLPWCVEGLFVVDRYQKAPEAMVVVHPPLAEYHLRSGDWRQYCLWMLLKYLSPRDLGVAGPDLVRLCSELGWMERSATYEVLLSGEGIWWHHSPDGLYRRSGHGIRGLYNDADVFPRNKKCKPKLVPLADFDDPKAMLLACIYSSTEWELQSRATIQERTGLSRGAQLRLERSHVIQKRSNTASLQGLNPTDAQIEVLGGVYTTAGYELLKRLPNSYKSAYAETSYGRVSQLRRNSRHSKGHGVTADGREPTKRYYDDHKSGGRARPPCGLAPGEIQGAVYSTDGTHFVCRRLPATRSEPQSVGTKMADVVKGIVESLPWLPAELSKVHESSHKSQSTK
jgi:hypothetical protein